MASYIGTDYTNMVGKVVADFSSYHYSYPDPNHFREGQCTWYAFGRAFDRYGGPINVSGNGGEWYKNVVVGNGVSKRSEAYDPVSKSIASFSNSDAGHVVFIEQVVGDNVYFTEGNSWCADGTVQSKSKKDFRTLWGNTLEGYIVLGTYNPETGN